MQSRLLTAVLLGIFGLAACTGRSTPDHQSSGSAEQTDSASTELTTDIVDSSESEIADGPEPCSTEWFAWVEDEVGTGDGAGHGPDPGSTEWKYTVLFKLGLEGKQGVPQPESDDWCGFIDEHLSSVD